MKRSTNVRNRCYRNFLMEFFFIQNTHPWGLHASCFIRRLISQKSTQFINLLLESINFTFSSMWICRNNFIVPKSFFSIGSHIGSHGVFGLVLICCNSNGWFSIGHIVFNSIFLVTFSNSFCSPLWKLATSFGSFLGCSSCFRLLMWPT